MFIPPTMARGGNSTRGNYTYRGSSSFRGGGSSSRGGSYRGGSSSYRGGRGRGRGGGAPGPARDDEGTQMAERFERVALEDEIDEKMGFARVSEGPRREGWLINMHPVRPPSLLSPPL